METLTQRHKRIALLAWMIMMATATMWGYDFESNGIYYNLRDGQAIVTNNGQTSCYSGTVTIPESVTHDDVTYPVTAIGDSAMISCRNVQRVIFPGTLTSIGKSAFAGCFRLQYAYLPGSLTLVGDFAFQGCSALKSILTLGDQVTAIGQEAFSGCSSLPSMSLGSALTSIGAGAFAGCTAIKTIKSLATVPPTVQDSTCLASCYGTAKLIVGNLWAERYRNAPYWSQFTSMETYADCIDGIYYKLDGDSLAVTYRDKNYNSYSGEVAIPETVDIDGTVYRVTAIGDYAFRGSTGLKRVTIPASVTSIGKGAFIKVGITEMTMPTGLTAIGDSVFAESRMFRFTLPEGYTSTSPYMLAQCHDLMFVSLPQSLTTIAAGTFNSCTQLRGIDLPQGLLEIGERAFGGCAGIENLELPEGLTTIGDYAFSFAMSTWDHSTPLELVIPESVTHLGKYALEGMMITSFTLPRSITTVSEGLLKWTSRLESVTLHDGVTAIETRAFFDSDISQIELPASVRVIGDQAFLSTNLRHFTISNTVDSLGLAVFRDCHQLQSVHIGSGISVLRDEVFYQCEELSQVTFDPATPLTNIGTRAFAGCSALKAIDLPATVTAIGTEAFLSDNLLLGINLPDSLTTIGSNAFKGCSAIEDIVVPCGVKSIGSHAFEKCTSLVSASLSENLETIGEYAFASCSSLKYIRIPDKIQEINYGLLSKCSSLQEVVVGKRVSKIEKWVFSNCNALKTVIMMPKVPPTFVDYTYLGPSGLTAATDVYVLDLENTYGKSEQWSGLTLKSIYKKQDVRLTQASIVSPDGMELLHGTLFRQGGDTLRYEAQDAIIHVTDMIPVHNDVTISFRDQLGYEHVIDDVIMTDSVQFSNYSSLRINNKLIEPMFTINCDSGFVPDSCGIIYKNKNYQGNVTLNYGDHCLVECAPITKGQPYSHQITPWVAFGGNIYQGPTERIGEDIVRDPMVGPTSVDMGDNAFIQDGEQAVKVYYTFEGEHYDHLLITGLDPVTTYHATCHIVGTDWSREVPFSFTTPPLTIAGTEACVTGQNVVMFKSWSNVIDEEKGCGYEWERVGVEGTTKQKGAYSFDGTLATIDNRIALYTPYRVRPFYKSASDSVYYGEWTEFSITENPGNYPPIAYLYKAVERTPTTATIHGLVLQGTSNIQVQRLEYWPNTPTNNDHVLLDVHGQTIDVTLTGLRPATSYTYKLVVVTQDPIPSEPWNHTLYSGWRNFTTLARTVDVNGDGEVGIADVNAALNIILNDDQVDDIDIDVNGDREGNIADVNAIIDKILEL